MYQARLTHQGITFRGNRGCFGTRATEVIPYDQIVACEETSTDWLAVSYVPVPKPMVTCSFRITPDESYGNPLEHIMREAYPLGLRTRFLVLINPKSGPGKANDNYFEYAQPIFDACPWCRTECRVTKYAGEGAEIAHNLNPDDYNCVICVSGDGLPHEVLNGFATRDDAATVLEKVAICQLPGGSGNALTHSVYGSGWPRAALGVIKGAPLPVDAMLCTQGDTQFYSFLSTTYGIVADCDLGTESWRWMGGLRFTVGAIVKCLAKNKYPCDIAYKVVATSRKSLQEHYNRHETPNISQAPISLQGKYGRVTDPIPDDWEIETHPDLSLFYVGKLPWMSSDALVFPLALPTDGAMDMMLWDNDLGRLRGLLTLAKFEKGDHIEDKRIRYHKVSAFRLTPHAQNYMDIDGESYPCLPIQVEILPSAINFWSPSGRYNLLEQ